VRRMHFAAPFDLDCVLFHCRLRFVTPISPEAVSEVNKGAREDIAVKPVDCPQNPLV